jgi:hypothetical protein
MIVIWTQVRHTVTPGVYIPIQIQDTLCLLDIVMFSKCVFVGVHGVFETTAAIEALLLQEMVVRPLVRATSSRWKRFSTRLICRQRCRTLCLLRGRDCGCKLRPTSLTRAGGAAIKCVQIVIGQDLRESGH